MEKKKFNLLTWAQRSWARDQVLWLVLPTMLITMGLVEYNREHNRSISEISMDLGLASWLLAAIIGAILQGRANKHRERIRQAEKDREQRIREAKQNRFWYLLARLEDSDSTIESQFADALNDAIDEYSLRAELKPNCYQSLLLASALMYGVIHAPSEGELFKDLNEACGMNIYSRDGFSYDFITRLAMFVQEDGKKSVLIASPGFRRLETAGLNPSTQGA